MSRGLTALLGLLAVAGYQNRDKIAEMLRGVGQTASGASGPGWAGRRWRSTNIRRSGTGGLGGLLEGFSGANPGGFLSSGLHDLVNSFDKTGQGEVAQSWVGRGPNKEIAPPDLEQAIGPDVLASLSERTGLSREELLQRLSPNSRRGRSLRPGGSAADRGGTVAILTRHASLDEGEEDAMSIFGKIKDAIFGSAEAKEAEPVGADGGSRGRHPPRP